VTVARIKSALGEPSESTEKQMARKNVDPSVLREIVRKLTQYAEEGDSDAFNYMESTREELAAACPPEVFARLRSSLRSYDFSVALETLQLIANAFVDGEGE
jgi:anthranilate/para-aminobenzoate synthase component I